MDQDTPEVDRTARTIAGNVYLAYWRQAKGSDRPQDEQTVLACLVEAIRPEIPGGSRGAIIAAANMVLDALEQLSPGIRGPRVRSLNRADGTMVVGPPPVGGGRAAARSPSSYRSPATRRPRCHSGSAAAGIAMPEAIARRP